ncbi:MAG: hypothetical protein JSC161_000751 [Candidatus Tokpelaia sp. JSC161]|jgi:uncharacterized membrane protein|nr:MAG: hypothetical protein JSC161_000751 [Candidatus Tokpelaia sp. JSC161]
MFWKQITECFLASTFLIIFTLPSYADFRVCNTTNQTVGVAIGYRTNTWRSEGWWKIKSNNCQILLEGALNSRFYYLYAEDEDGSDHWDGAVKMCVSDSEFKIDGVKNCFARGFQKFGFQEIDTKNQSNWMVQLTEPTKNPTGTIIP